MNNDRNSEQFRRECEARHVLKYSQAGRENYYAKVLPLRGQKTTNELAAEVERQSKLLKEKSAEMEM